MSDLLFAELELPRPERVSWLRQILEKPSVNWLFDKYRGSWMLPLRTQSGGASYADALNRNVEHSCFQWTNFAGADLQNYFEKNIFSWSNPQCRIVAVRTPAGHSNFEHIDCAPDKLGTRQHKFRLVLQGRVSTLYFITEQGRVYAPEGDGAFIMDGSWPHGMENLDTQDKITLCMGSPWTYGEKYPSIRNFLSKKDYAMPADYKKYFAEKYTVKMV